MHYSKYHPNWCKRRTMARARRLAAVMSCARGRRGGEAHGRAHTQHSPRHTRCTPHQWQCVATNIIQIDANGAPWCVREGRPPSRPAHEVDGAVKDTDACTIADQGDLPGVRTIYASALQQKSSKMMQRSSQGGARSDSPVDIASTPNFSYRLPSPIYRPWCCLQTVVYPWAGTRSTRGRVHLAGV